MTALSIASLLTVLAVAFLPQAPQVAQARSSSSGQPLADVSPRPRYRLGLAGAFVVWLIVFAGMVAYLAAH